MGRGRLAAPGMGMLRMGTSRKWGWGGIATAGKAILRHAELRGITFGTTEEFLIQVFLAQHIST